MIYGAIASIPIKEQLLLENDRMFIDEEKLQFL